MPHPYIFSLGNESLVSFLPGMRLWCQWTNKKPITAPSGFTRDSLSPTLQWTRKYSIEVCDGSGPLRSTPYPPKGENSFLQTGKSRNVAPQGAPGGPGRAVVKEVVNEFGGWVQTRCPDLLAKRRHVVSGVNGNYSDLCYASSDKKSSFQIRNQISSC